MSFGSKEEIYGNYQVLDPDGCLMFRCDSKKFGWYLRKNLAEQIEPNVIKLKFKPAGQGYRQSSYYLQDRANICVVCGKKEDLSRHHVVPYCYRKCFPEHIKKHNYYDVLPLCTDCHDKYEAKYALKKRKELAQQYDAPVHGVGIRETCEKQNRACRAANTLFFHGKKIPAEKRRRLLSSIEEFLGKEPTEQEIESMAEVSISRYCKGPFYKTHGELVVAKIESIGSFVKEWRKHFVSTMKPKFLPSGWGIDGSVMEDKKA